MTEQPSQLEETSKTPRAADWACKPTSAFLAWWLPIALGISSNLLPSALKARGVPTLVWAIAFAWMGAACLLNARRCHRVHCYISGPILLVSALVLGLIGLGIVSVSQNGLNLVAWATFGLVVLSYIPELILGRYRH